MAITISADAQAALIAALQLHSFILASRGEKRTPGVRTAQPHQADNTNKQENGGDSASFPSPVVRSRLDPQGRTIYNSKPVLIAGPARATTSNCPTLARLGMIETEEKARSPLEQALDKFMVWDETTCGGEPSGQLRVSILETVPINPACLEAIAGMNFRAPLPAGAYWEDQTEVVDASEMFNTFINLDDCMDS